jgi:RsiW-degrading membrane proteinase PrsW (M82 family)
LSRFCLACGTLLQSGVRFCPACGWDQEPAGGSSSPGAEPSGSPAEPAASAGEILRSPVFRFVCLFALTPLLLVELRSYRAILNGIAVWSGVLWLLLFYRLFSDARMRLSSALLALFGTMLLVVPAFELYLTLPPHVTRSALERPTPLSLLAGYVLGVGLQEEIVKAMAVLVALLLTRGALSPLHGLVLGMMAGVGFAVSENVYYVYGMLEKALEESRETGDVSVMIFPIYGNVVRMMVGPFAHGVFSGILGHQLALGATTRSPRPVLSGLAVVALLHGVYDLAVHLAPALGVMVLGGSYFMLMSYLLAARRGTSAGALAAGVFQHTVVRRVSPRAADVPALTLRGIAGPVEGRRYRVVDETKLGRDDVQCAIHIPEPSVSRQHAIIQTDGGGFVVRRLSDTAMVRVNDLPVAEAQLSAGDRIQVGTAILLVEES